MKVRVHKNSKDTETNKNLDLEHKEDYNKVVILIDIFFVKILDAVSKIYDV